MNLRALSALFLTTTAANADVPNVVTDIPAVHSLVSQVMGDLGQPELLMKQGASPHGYSMRPSEARALQEADIVFWIGEELTPWLESSIETLGADAESVELLQAPGTEVLNFRETPVFAEDGHDDHDDHEDEHHDDHGDHDDHKDEHHDDHDDHDDHKDEHHDDHDDHAEDGHDDHGHGAHAFEWAGLFDLDAGTYIWSFAKVDGDYADPAMKMVVLRASDIEAVEEAAEELLEADASDAKSAGDVLVAAEMAYSLNFDAASDMTVFEVSISEAGTYAFFTEHMPFEFEADEHFFKDMSGADVEPVAQEPEMGGHDDHGHGDHHGHHHDHDGADPHAWLDPHNAEAWVGEIAEHLAELDPANAATYEANAAAAAEALEALEESLSAQLAPYSDAKFIVFHDAYQYFEHATGLNATGALQVSDATPPSAARLAEIQAEIQEHSIDCVFSEPQFSDALVKSVTNGQVSSTSLDPLGVGLELGAGLYAELLQNIADSIEGCVK